MRNAMSTIAVVSVAIGNSADAGTASWRCEFPHMEGPMTLTTELGTGKGIIGGNVGTSNLWVVEGSGVISFVETVLSGAVMTTRIWTKTGEAVHSRNYVNTERSELLKDWLGRVRRFIPQQYIGKKINLHLIGVGEVHFASSSV